MNIRLSTLMLLLLLAGAQTGSCFYNPQPGRWLNRDPIEEKGGLNIYQHVNNDPIIHFDSLGQLVVFPFPGLSICGNCAGKTFNSLTHCCCNGKIVSKTPVDSGVVSHKWNENPNGAGPYHVWLTWPGGTIDSNADALIKPPGAAGDQKIHSPATIKEPNVPTSLKLSPCQYDFAKLTACLSKKATELEGSHGGICKDFAEKIFDDCKNESKGCTAPP